MNQCELRCGFLDHRSHSRIMSIVSRPTKFKNITLLQYRTPKSGFKILKRLIKPGKCSTLGKTSNRSTCAKARILCARLDQISRHDCFRLASRVATNGCHINYPYARERSQSFYRHDGSMATTNGTYPSVGS